MATSAEFDNRVYAYFGPRRVVVAETFTPSVGWEVWPRYRKGVTLSWARKLRRQGVTVVALTDGTRTADFPLPELLAT